MSKTHASLIHSVAGLLTCYLSKRRKNKVLARVAERMILQQEESIETEAGSVKFLPLAAPNLSSRIENFYLDEPETVAWINDYVQRGEILWDIGANVGVYSLYAAKTKQAVVYAFEPSGLNYAVLLRHIAMNGLQDYVHPVPAALSERTALETLYMKTSEGGGAMNALGAPASQNGDFEPAMWHSVLSLAPEDVCQIFNIPQPRHIKLDVDGLEYKILSALKPVLQHVSTIIVEVQGVNADQNASAIHALLSNFGLEEVAGLQGEGAQRNRLFVRHSSNLE